MPNRVVDFMRQFSRIFRAMESRYGRRTDKSEGSGAMSDYMSDVVDVDDRERLIEEISLLRGKVARLQERVEQLDQLAHQDALIDLPNRRGFMRELERLIARVDRYGINGAMLFVDLDGLKIINDTLRPPRRRRSADPGRGVAGQRRPPQRRGGADRRRRVRDPARKLRRGRGARNGRRA